MNTGRTNSTTSLLSPRQTLDRYIRENETLSEMIKKYLGNVTQIFEENYGDHANQEELQFKRDVEEILSIDEILNSDFDEWVLQLQNFDKGDNNGIRERLFDLKHNLLDLQVKVIIRKQSRAQKDPNMLQIIELLNRKVRLVKDLMNFTLEEEHQIFVPEQDNPDEIYYKTDIPKHVKGANKYEQEGTKKNLQKIFGECKVDDNEGSIIDVESMYNTVSDMLENDQTFKFGSIFTNILPNYNKKTKGIRYDKVNNEEETCEKVFSQMTFLYMKMSDTFREVSVSKLSNLLLKKTFQPQKPEIIASLFIPLVKEDVDVIALFKVSLKQEINNDTSIANSFLKKNKIKFIFLFRYVSMLYERITTLKKNKIQNTKLFNLIFIRLSFYINVLNKYANNHKDEIENAHRSLIENTAPIEIYLNEYNQSTTPLYKVEKTALSDKFQITLGDTKTKYKGVVDGFFREKKMIESLNRTIGENKNIVLFAYGQSIPDEASFFYDTAFLNDFLYSLDKSVNNLTLKIIQIFYKWSYDLKKTETKDDFVLSYTPIYNCQLIAGVWMVVSDNEKNKMKYPKLIDFLKERFVEDGTIKKTTFNANSSRSHLVTNITLGNTEQTKIVIVDAAGFQGYDYEANLHEIILLSKYYETKDLPFFEDYYTNVHEEMKESIKKDTPFEKEISNLRYSLIHQLYEIITYKKQTFDISRQQKIGLNTHLDFKFYRDSVPLYLENDTKDRKHFDEMITDLQSQISGYQLDENFIELYSLQQKSTESLYSDLLNEIEKQILFLHNALFTVLDFIKALQNEFKSTNDQDPDFKNKVNVFCRKEYDHGSSYKVFELIFTGFPSLILINKERQGFDFDVTPENGDDDSLMKGMYKTANFDSLNDFFVTILRNVENDFILFEIHVFNYKFRKQEQSFINRSIIKMKESVSDFLVYSLSRGFDDSMSSDILYYVGYPEMQCSNLFNRYIPYSVYKYDKKVTKEKLINDDILFKVIFGNENIQIVKGCGVDIDRTKLFLVPVIDCNTYVHNIPILPYIDVGEIIRYLKYLEYFKQIEKYIEVLNKKDEHIATEYRDIKTKWDTVYAKFNEQIFEKIYNYNYYDVDETLYEMITGKDLTLEDPELTEKILRHINENNELTLVGTLNFSRFQSVLSSNSMMYHRVCEESDAVQFDLEKV